MWYKSNQCRLNINISLSKLLSSVTEIRRMCITFKISAQIINQEKVNGFLSSIKYRNLSIKYILPKLSLTGSFPLNYKNTMWFKCRSCVLPCKRSLETGICILFYFFIFTHEQDLLSSHLNKTVTRQAGL